MPLRLSSGPDAESKSHFLKAIVYFIAAARRQTGRLKFPSYELAAEAIGLPGCFGETYVD